MCLMLPLRTYLDNLKPFETTGRRCRWINQIQEFNIDVQITKLVRGQGLAKLMAESNLEAVQVHQVDGDQNVSIERCPWYSDIVYYLQHTKCRDNLNENQKRTIKL